MDRHGKNTHQTHNVGPAEDWMWTPSSFGDGPGRFLWNGLQSYLLICLIGASLYLVVAAILAREISVIAGIIGLWIILLDLSPRPGILGRIRATLAVSATGRDETAADRLPVLIRIGGAGLTLWAFIAVHH